MRNRTVKFDELKGLAPEKWEDIKRVEIDRKLNMDEIDLAHQANVAGVILHPTTPEGQKSLDRMSGVDA